MSGDEVLVRPGVRTQDGGLRLRGERGDQAVQDPDERADALSVHGPHKRLQQEHRVLLLRLPLPSPDGHWRIFTL